MIGKFHNSIVIWVNRSFKVVYSDIGKNIKSKLKTERLWDSPDPSH